MSKSKHEADQEKLIGELIANFEANKDLQNPEERLVFAIGYVSGHDDELHKLLRAIACK